MDIRPNSRHSLVTVQAHAPRDPDLDLVCGPDLISSSKRKIEVEDPHKTRRTNAREYSWESTNDSAIEMPQRSQSPQLIKENITQTPMRENDYRKEDEEDDPNLFNITLSSPSTSLLVH